MLNIVEARQHLTEVVNRVAFGDERIVIGRRGKALAVVISMRDFALLERLIEAEEDRIDVAEANHVEADPADESVPWEQAKQELKR